MQYLPPINHGGNFSSPSWAPKRRSAPGDALRQRPYACSGPWGQCQHLPLGAPRKTGQEFLQLMVKTCKKMVSRFLKPSHWTISWPSGRDRCAKLWNGYSACLTHWPSHSIGTGIAGAAKHVCKNHGRSVNVCEYAKGNNGPSHVRDHPGMQHLSEAQTPSDCGCGYSFFPKSRRSYFHKQILSFFRRFYWKQKTHAKAG